MAEAGYMLPSWLLQTIEFVLENIVDDADRKLYPLETPNANYPQAFATALKIASVYLSSGGYSADEDDELLMLLTVLLEDLLGVMMRSPGTVLAAATLLTGSGGFMDIMAKQLATERRPAKWRRLLWSAFTILDWAMPCFLALPGEQLRAVERRIVGSGIVRWMYHGLAACPTPLEEVYYGPVTSMHVRAIHLARYVPIPDRLRREVTYVIHAWMAKVAQGGAPLVRLLGGDLDGTKARLTNMSAEIMFTVMLRWQCIMVARSDKKASCLKHMVHMGMRPLDVAVLAIKMIPVACASPNKSGALTCISILLFMLSDFVRGMRDQAEAAEDEARRLQEGQRHARGCDAFWGAVTTVAQLPNPNPGDVPPLAYVLCKPFGGQPLMQHLEGAMGPASAAIKALVAA